MTFRINNLTGFGGGGGGFSFALVDTDTTQNNKDNPTFANMNAGVQGGGRLLIAVIVCIDTDINSSPTWPATCTIGGVTADKDVSNAASSAQPWSIGVAIYSAVVPSGATVNVAVTITFSGTMNDWACALFRTTRINKTPIDTDTGLTGVDLNTAGAKFAVFGTADGVGAPPGSWTGGGNTMDAVAHNQIIIGYDDAPLGGAPDTYDAPGGNVFAGASYG